MFEERALLLGKLGQHKEALAIYVYILRDHKMAEEYVVAVFVIHCHLFNNYCYLVIKF